MAYVKNVFGVPQYPDTDARYLLVLLAAIDLLERPSASAIADLTGADKEKLDNDVQRLREQYGLTIHKVGDFFHIESWGDLLKPEGVRNLLAR